MSAPAVKPARRRRSVRKRKPRRAYVVVDQATEDTDAGAAAVDAWLTEAPKSV